MALRPPALAPETALQLPVTALTAGLGVGGGGGGSSPLKEGRGGVWEKGSGDSTIVEKKFGAGGAGRKYFFSDKCACKKDGLVVCVISSHNIGVFLGGWYPRPHLLSPEATAGPRGGGGLEEGAPATSSAHKPGFFLEGRGRGRRAVVCWPLYPPNGRLVLLESKRVAQSRHWSRCAFLRCGVVLGIDAARKPHLRAACRRSYDVFARGGQTTQEDAFVCGGLGRGCRPVSGVGRPLPRPIA